ncbi:histidine kinase dimerization/phosphoacceptor domain -containing protein [Niastella sp. OAS944]|uniref:tetratricopeptide repeat-containing sensor histidine kinase n=1 Tax=Niastella sp. OAS944 TaxID=2664089 RepID=UPI0034931C09|nr:two-component sensor histidine kinase [Chitinophagaceae bacterium OAS944]
MKKRIFLLFLTAFYLQVHAQNVPWLRLPVPGDEAELLTQLEKSKPGIVQIEILLLLGQYYLLLPGEELVDVNKAMDYANKARIQAMRFNFTDGYHAALIITGNVYSTVGNWDANGKVLDSAVTGIDKEWHGKKPGELPERELRLLIQLGEAYLHQYKTDIAEKYFLEAIAFCKTKGFTKLQYIYDRLITVQALNNSFNRMLYYELEAVKAMENTGDLSSASSLYHKLGFTYRIIGQFQRAVEYYDLAYSYDKKKPSSVIFELGFLHAEALTKMGRARDGIAQVLEKCQAYAPRTNQDKRNVEDALGTCYRVLKQYDSAEVHFLNLIRYQREDMPYNQMDAKKHLAQLYIECGRYVKAKPLLDECLASGFFANSAHFYFMLFKSDSAAGNHLLAMQHLMRNKEIDEVGYQEAKVRENRELQIKYETEKKDKDIRIKEQDILLLTNLSQLQRQRMQQAQLEFSYDSLTKEQNIQALSTASAKKDKDILLKQQRLELLSKQDQLKQAKLQTANWLKDVTLVGILLLFIILGLLYNQYRVKQRNNQEISIKNLTLEHLLEEKEWLLKEVHHRVKNNLHTIMSLLQSQSAYLKDDALKAVQNSQHRVYAMSLIHQKLYQNENSTNIDMMLYLPELLQYLRDGFDIKHQIQITTDIRDIHLDISKAIPVGLILNEAVTNAIKYAFPGGRRGEITIGMERVADKRIRLCIADNGIGIPDNWNKMQRDSLGLRLMKGLSDDVRGDFSIDNSYGTKITVEFQEELFSFEPRKARKKTGELNS